MVPFAMYRGISPIKKFTPPRTTIRPVVQGFLAPKKHISSHQVGTAAAVKGTTADERLLPCPSQRAE